MPDAAVARTDHELQILASLVDCAHALSVTLAEAAKAEADRVRQLQLFEAFQRGFLAVRMGIRLSMALRAPAKAAPRPEVERLETERLETERLQDPPETDEPRFTTERERERDYEPVSLPKFLSTLGLVARDAARIEGLPANVRTDLLPKLDTLLSRVKPPAAPPSAPAALAVLTRPKTPPRAALLGATSAISTQPLAFHGKPRPPPYQFG